jgi:hypothetical protein
MGNEETGTMKLFKFLMILFAWFTLVRRGPVDVNEGGIAEAIFEFLVGHSDGSVGFVIRDQIDHRLTFGILGRY